MTAAATTLEGPMPASVRSLVEGLRAEPGSLVEAIARDVGEPEPTVRVAFERQLELILAVAGTGSDAATGDAPEVRRVLDRLRADGVAAARAGIGLARLLDRHLSTGWVLWAAAAARRDVGAATLGALGTALLRAGDLAAAAIADGYGAAEKERVARSAAALRELLDDLLEPAGDDPSRPGRLGRTAHAVGVDPSRPLRAVVAWLGAEVDDVDPRSGRVARGLARPRRAGATGTEVPVSDPLPLVATRRGRLVVLDAADRGIDPRLARLLDEVAPAGWWAVAAAPADRLADIAAAAGDALAALAVATRLPVAGRVLDVADVALERALLADEAHLRAAVAAELGPLVTARGGPELVETLDGYLAAGMSVTGAARVLHVAPRTVAYRLERIEALRGGPLDAAAWRRYAILLEARRLLGG